VCVTSSFLSRLRKAVADAGIGRVDLAGIEVALTHASYANETGERCAHNERLEFLGDAVLGLCVADELFRDHPDLGPGEMTRLRAAVVSGEALAQVGRDWDLGSELRLGQGEAANGGHERGSNIGRAVEAIFGVLYLNLGYEQTRSLIRRVFGPRISASVEESESLDAKTALQEKAQAEGMSPRYDVVARAGPDHAPRWVVRVEVGPMSARAEGSSKRLAERAAAQELLSTWPGED